jgi:fructosamine-3-kinase
VSDGLGYRLPPLLGSEVVAVQPVGGGCIADARRVDLQDGRTVFVKSADGLPTGLLAVEAEGLRWLREPRAISVPDVLVHDPAGNGADGGEAPLLVLEWIEAGRPTSTTGERLGRGLAQLHAAGGPQFGWERDGFIGSLPQRNTPGADDWPTFWFTRRIEPLAEQAVARGSLAPSAAGLVARLGDRLSELAGPPEPPARVHGDLWVGNLMIDRDGEPWLIDPAAYGGHREVDLAMLHLFGSPPTGTQEAYDETFPLADGWRDRQSLWQLEPLLTHTVMFGGSYGSRAEAVLRRFT